MKTPIMFAAFVAVLNLGATSTALAETTGCSLAVDRARSDLNDAGLRQIIAKPSQNFVAKSGVVYTGDQVSFMRRQIGLARDACLRGTPEISAIELQKMYAKLNSKE